jgi:hypothetical protein
MIIDVPRLRIGCRPFNHGIGFPIAIGNASVRRASVQALL